MRNHPRESLVGKQVLAVRSQVAVAGERWADWVRRLPPGHRAVLERLRDGHTHEEVAAMLNVSVRTVERIVRRLKDLPG